jgi:ATP-dependent Zn protease
MATAEPLAPLSAGESSRLLADQWRRLARAGTLVAVLTSPAVFVWLHSVLGYSMLWSLVGTFLTVIAFRGAVDLIFRRAIPWPSLFGADTQKLREEDVVNRRRVWFWRFWLRFTIVGTVLAIPLTLLWRATGAEMLIQVLPLLIMLPLFLIFNFVILFGPLLMLNLSQVRGFEPGDAEWGVKLADVRGQAEAKEEVRRIVTLWQSGEAFEKAGGKRERGLLFLGAPGTGKTMLAKAIATGFNSPFVSIPGSGFAATFIGIDAIVVRFLARKAKKLARKWGGQCIVFIDEIDAVGMRRQALGTGAPGAGGSWTPTSAHDLLFFGPHGALNPSGDMILETRAWRDRLFTARAPEAPSLHSGLYQRLGSVWNFMFPGGMGGMGGGLALNQLLVVMDGIDNPPFTKRVSTNKVNTFLDATYIVPRRLGRFSLRLRPPRPRKEQIYFVGATNVPIERLDPALIRPGRMGRHVWFRTPTKNDRLDVFDLYINRVAHEPDLDTPRRRDELARITNGYSPAMIDQVCSMALTIAHHSGRERFGWDDIVEAMTTVESGTAIGVKYIAEETRAVAIHEAGHAIASHVYMEGFESTRISIRMRAGSLGHHQALQKEERFSSWRHEEMARLIWGLGAMAAERVFYGENASGVGGDVYSATAQAAYMVGASAMGPERVELSRKVRAETEDETRERIMKRFEQIGLQIMNRTTPGGPMAQDPIAGVLSDPHKRALAAQILGQAYIKAHHLMAHNREGIELIAGTLIERKELYGNELVELLESADLKAPEIDLLEESSWPRI